MDDDGPALARAFLESLTSKDRTAMTSLLAADVDFRGLTASQEWRATTPEEVAEIVFGSWFESHVFLSADEERTSRMSTVCSCQLPWDEATPG